MPEKPPKSNPLHAVHAARQQSEPPDKDTPDDADAPDPIQLAVVQGLAANPATALMDGEAFAIRVDELVASLGIPSSALESGQRKTASENESTQLRAREHIRVLVDHLQGHPRHTQGECPLCEARDWLETL